MRDSHVTHTLKFWSNFAQKWAKIFHLTLNSFWDISFRVFFSEICHFEFSISNEIVITWVLYGQSSWKFAPLYFLGRGIQKSHLKSVLSTRNRSNFKLKNKFFITDYILPHNNWCPIFQCGTISIISKFFLLDVNMIKIMWTKN